MAHAATLSWVDVFEDDNALSWEGETDAVFAPAEDMFLDMAPEIESDLAEIRDALAAQSEDVTRHLSTFAISF